ncbi:uncharacterized protein LOC144288024 [Canis aureus]
MSQAFFLGGADLQHASLFVQAIAPTPPHPCGLDLQDRSPGGHTDAVINEDHLLQTWARAQSQNRGHRDNHAEDSCCHQGLSIHRRTSLDSPVLRQLVLVGSCICHLHIANNTHAFHARGLKREQWICATRAMWDCLLTIKLRPSKTSILSRIRTEF